MASPNPPESEANNRPPVVTIGGARKALEQLRAEVSALCEQFTQKTGLIVTVQTEAIIIDTTRFSEVEPVKRHLGYRTFAKADIEVVEL